MKLIEINPGCTIQSSLRWHQVRAKRDFAKATLTVDSYPTVTARSRGAHSRLNAGDALYLGGAPNIPRQVCDSVILWWSVMLCDILPSTSARRRPQHPQTGLWFCDSVMFCDYEILWWAVIYCDVLWYCDDLWYTLMFCDILSYRYIVPVIQFLHCVSFDRCNL